MTGLIHPTATIDPAAKLAADVQVGAHTYVGPDVEIGAGTRIGPQCLIEGPTWIGRNNQIYGCAAIGGAPQDKKYDDEPTRLEIGDRNTIREFCSFNVGTAQDAGVTIVGNDNWIMAYVHVAHDCVVGNNTIFANNATLAGHVQVGDWAILGGFTGVHQFGRVGAHSFCGVGTVLTQDLPPYVTVSGNPAAPHGINSEGLKRRGFSADDIAAIKRAYRTLYRSGLALGEARLRIAESAAESEAVRLFSDFIADSGRGIVR